MEIQDWDILIRSQNNSLGPDSPLMRWNWAIIQGYEQNGRTGRPFLRLPRCVADAGFVRIHHEVYTVPIGTWPETDREVGSNLSHAPHAHRAHDRVPTGEAHRYDTF